MKRLLASLGALSAIVLVSAAPVPVDSAITAVTVYTDRAVVTRTGTVELPGGITELTFVNLPQALNEHSLQVSGKGTAQALILDVATKQTYVDFTPNARVKELEDQLRALQKQTRALDDRTGVLQAESTILDRMEAALFAPPAKDVPRPDLEQFTKSLTYLSEQKTRLATARTALDESREDLNNKINATQNSLNELRGAGGRGYKTVTVRVSAPQAGNLAVALSYAVPGASWVPSYDARVLSSERAVSLLVKTNCIDNAKKIWWDIRLHPFFDTIEFRVCDIPMRVDETIALAALMQALVAKLHKLLKQNLSWRNYRRRLLDENRWRASRYGLDGKLIDFGKQEEVPTRDLILELLDLVDQEVDEFGSRKEINYIHEILKNGTGADRQLAVWRKTHDPKAVVDYIVSETTTGLKK